MHHLLNLFSLYAFSAKLNKIKNPIRVNEYLETQDWTKKSIMHLLAVLFHYLVTNVYKQYCNWKLRGNIEALYTEIFFSFWLGSTVIILGKKENVMKQWTKRAMG